MDRTRLAVFDVDETILCVKGLFKFAEYFFCDRHGATGMVHGQPFEEWMALLQSVGRSKPREYVNRLFYTAFKGYPVALMEDSARDWFEGLLRREETMFIRATLAAVHACRARDLPVVLLSGSARIFLAPLAQLLGAAHVLAIGLVLDAEDKVTGAIMQPQTIGAGKWTALAALLDELDIAPAHCIGYGDHPSDLPFLLPLGQVGIVAGNSEMEQVAVARGWEILPSTAAAYFPAPPPAILGAPAAACAQLA